ncbi:MAG: hypothetical protein GQ539_01160 [Sulfitobacter sp.]|nr:hypothetical protein [Sulfitobacter sp.]
MSDFESAMAPEPKGESLLPQHRARLYELMFEEEATFRQGLASLFGQIRRPHRPDLEIREHEWDRFNERADRNAIARMIIADYLDFDAELETLPEFLESHMQISSFKTLRYAPEFPARVIDAVYSVFGPFHAQGGWFDIADQVYVPICSVICTDSTARKGIESEITYVTGGASSATVKVKIAGAGFGGAFSKDLTVSSQYPAVKGIQQVTSPVNLSAKLFVNPSTGERAFRIRIKNVGAPSHVDENSPNFAVPKVKRWDRGDFGSSIAAGSKRTFNVNSKANFDAAVPIKVQNTNLDLGYTVAKSQALTVQTTALVCGVFEQLSVGDSAFALQFTRKP